MAIDLNSEQRKHLAGSFRAIGMGQLAAIGYKGFFVLEGPDSIWKAIALLASGLVILIILEIASLLVLNKGVDE